MGSHFSHDSDSEDGNFQPNFADAIIVFLSLQRCSYLLPEHAVTILEMAGYCPQIEFSNDSHHFGADNEDAVYMRGNFQPTRYFLPTSIDIVTVSRDQGWSSYPEHHGTRLGSFSWIEVSLSYNQSKRYHVATNIHAGPQFESQTTIFDINSDLLRDIRQHIQEHHTDEFCLELRSRSQYPGWRNRMLKAQIIVTFGQIINHDQILAQYSKR